MNLANRPNKSSSTATRRALPRRITPDRINLHPRAAADAVMPSTASPTAAGSEYGAGAETLILLAIGVLAGALAPMLIAAATLPALVV